jgi:hypothetical protein
MTLMIDLPEDLETRLQDEVNRTGTDAATFTLQALREILGASENAATLSEADLLERINASGFNEAFWKRYRELAAMRDAEVLTEAEQAELITLSDRIEARDAERVRYLVALAALRKVSLEELVQQLGLRPANPLCYPKTQK